MGSEVPGNVNVFLEEAEVQSTRADVAEYPDVAAVDDLLDAPDGGGIEEGVADHEHQPAGFGNLDQFLALSRGPGHWFFDEGMFAGQ